MEEGERDVSPHAGQNGLERGMWFSHVSSGTPPPPGSELGCRDPRPPERGHCRPPILVGLHSSPETPPGPGRRKWRGGPGKRGLLAGGRAQRGRGVALGREGDAARPPIPSLRGDPQPANRASRRAHRLHGGGHVVVTLRLLGQPRPLQQLLSVPHVARGSASPRARTARLPARSPCVLSLVAAEAAAAHAHWLAGRPKAADCRALPPLPPSRWLAPHAVARAADAAEGGEAAARGDGRMEDACAVGAAGPGGGERPEWEGGRAGRP